MMCVRRVEPLCLVPLQFLWALKYGWTSYSVIRKVF